MNYFKLNTLIILMSLLALCSCSKELSPQDIQERLDNGETPWEIEQMDTERSAHFWGLRYAGGIIIDYNYEDGTGLVASEEDLGLFPWGCYDTLIAFQDTLIIDCGIGSASRACHDYVHKGYDDWFLLWLEGLGDFNSLDYTNAVGEYWTSTGWGDNQSVTIFVNQPENCHESEWEFGTYTNCSEKVDRNELKLVRAVRKF